MRSVEVVLALGCLVARAGAARKAVQGEALGADVEEVAAAFGAEASTLGFCSSARCDGYTDQDESAKHQLKFNKPFEWDEQVSRAEVAKEVGYPGYHHGKLRDCAPVHDMFSYGERDWSLHMELNMRDGIWPNQPGELKYRCAERCMLEISGEDGKQLNAGEEPEVWVEREGHSGDLLAGLSFVGWSPPQCTVGNTLQAYWMKQKFLHETPPKDSLMSDREGLPVFPTPSEPYLRPIFNDRFCKLTMDEKASVTKRVTRHRPRGLGLYERQMRNAARLRRWFPKGFPEKCDDGWRRETAPIWNKKEQEEDEEAVAEQETSQ